MKIISSYFYKILHKNVKGQIINQEAVRFSNVLPFLKIGAEVGA